MSQKNKIVNHGLYIPRGIAELTLTWAAKILLSQIDYLDNGYRGCYAGIATLARMSGMGEGSVRNEISRLKKMGYLIEINVQYEKRGLRAVFTRYKKDEFEDNTSYRAKRAQILREVYGSDYEILSDMDLEFERIRQAREAQQLENSEDFSNGSDVDNVVASNNEFEKQNSSQNVTGELQQCHWPVTNNVTGQLHIKRYIKNKIKRKGARRRASSSFPLSFTVSDETKQWARLKGLSNEALNEQVTEFIEYFTIGEGMGVEKKNWDLTLKNWINRALKWGYVFDRPSKKEEITVRTVPKVMPCEFCQSAKKYGRKCPFHGKTK